MRYLLRRRIVDPRVHTILREREAPTPTPPPAVGADPEKKEFGWHDLIREILESLFPFPDSYTVVRKTPDAFGEKLSSPA